MTELLLTVINISITASIVAAAVLLIRIPLKKAPKIFSYGLWAAVFWRLICPFNIESPAGLIPAGDNFIPAAITTGQGASIHYTIAVPGIADHLLTDHPAQPVAYSAASSPAQTVLTIGAVLWLCGIVVLLLHAVIGYIRLRRQVYDATLVRDNIYETDKIPTAFVLGMAHPNIYVPAAVKGEQLEYMIRHEQVHIRRRDYLIKPLAYLILAVHWFNPIVWLSCHLMSEDMEMSCDEAVLRKANDDIRQAYSLSLVNLYTRNPRHLSSPAFGEGNKKNLQTRIENVLNFKKTPRWTIAVCSLITLLFTAGFVTSPVSAAIPSTTTENSTSRKPYFEHYSNNPGTAITASSRTGNWAMSDTAAGQTPEQILDSKLAFIEDVWQNSREPFIIAEGISAEAITDVNSLRYLYDKSEIYRQLITADDALYIRPSCSFSLLADPGNSPMYDRYAFYLPEAAELSLTAICRTDAGKISLTVVSPSGEILCQNEFTSTLDNHVSLKLEPGISSIILGYQTDGDVCQGNIDISGRIKKSNKAR